MIEFAEEVVEQDTRSTVLKVSKAMAAGSYVATFTPPPPKLSEYEKRQIPLPPEILPTITQAAEPMETVKGAAAPIRAAAVAMGWETAASRSSTRHEAVLYVAQSDEHNEGDVRYPTEDREHLWLDAKHPAAALGFRAHWETRIGPNGKPKTAFSDVTIFDYVGIPVENGADYTASNIELKRWQAALGELAGKKRAEEISNQQAYDYNDGTDRLEHSRLIRTATDFKVWLDDWLFLSAPSYPPLIKPKQEAPTEPEYPGLDLAEWSSE